MKQLTLEEVEAQLGPLETPKDVLRRAERITTWVCDGRISRSAAEAALNACHLWLAAWLAQQQQTPAVWVVERLDVLRKLLLVDGSITPGQSKARMN